MDWWNTLRTVDWMSSFKKGCCISAYKWTWPTSSAWGVFRTCPGDHRVVVTLPFSWVIQTIAECLSMRKLIVQCSHVASVRLYIVSISVLHGPVGTCSTTTWLIGSALPASDSAQSVPVCGLNFCCYNTMELELNQSAVWTRRDLLILHKLWSRRCLGVIVLTVCTLTFIQSRTY